MQFCRKLLLISRTPRMCTYIRVYSWIYGNHPTGGTEWDCVKHVYCTEKKCFKTFEQNHTARYISGTNTHNSLEVVIIWPGGVMNYMDNKEERFCWTSVKVPNYRIQWITFSFRLIYHLTKTNQSGETRCPSRHINSGTNNVRYSNVCNQSKEIVL